MAGSANHFSNSAVIPLGQDSAETGQRASKEGSTKSYLGFIGAGGGGGAGSWIVSVADTHSALSRGHRRDPLLHHWNMLGRLLLLKNLTTVDENCCRKYKHEKGTKPPISRLGDHLVFGTKKFRAVKESCWSFHPYSAFCGFSRL